MDSETGTARGAVAPGREGGGTPVADRIRERIRKARGRFRANDNIACYVEEGELCGARSRARSRRCCGRW